MNKQEYEIMYALERVYWWYQGLHDLVEQFCKKAIAGNEEARILDAGCGTGGMLLRLTPLGQLAGVDYAEEAIAYCKSNGLVYVYQEDLNNWSPLLSSYDVIISLDVLCHTAIVDDRHVINLFQKALKPGGILILNLPAFPSLFRNHDLAVHTRRRYKKKALESMLGAAGFSIVTLTYRQPHIFVLLFLKKLFEKLVKSPQQQSDLVTLPTWINTTLAFLHRVENRFILSGGTLPFGSSVFVVAQKR